MGVVKSSLSPNIAVVFGTLDKLGHTGDFGNAAKLVGEMSKSLMQLISIHF